MNEFKPAEVKTFCSSGSGFSSDGCRQVTVRRVTFSPEPDGPAAGGRGGRGGRGEGRKRGGEHNISEPITEQLVGRSLEVV